MDQEVLVRVGHGLVKALDDSGRPPRAAMWTYYPDTGSWKLWIVPHKSQASDKRDFYRAVATLIQRNRGELGSIDAADVEVIKEDHPGILAMGKVFRMPGLVVARFSQNTFNGFYLPDGIVLRMDL